MERPRLLSYTRGHETSRNRHATGTAPPTGHPIAQGGYFSVGNRTDRWCLRKFRVSLGHRLPKTGSTRIAVAADARTSSQSLPGAEERLAARLLKGPLAAGYRTDLWTLKRVAQLIHQQFRVRYHPCHVWKLLTSLGWTCQKPERRALQRDDAAIARWKRTRWPHIKKRRATWCPPRLPG